MDRRALHARRPSRALQLMTPVAEVDMQRFIQAKRRLEGAHDRALRASTAGAPRQVRAFRHGRMAPRAPPLELRPGRYCFEALPQGKQPLAPRSSALRAHPGAQSSSRITAMARRFTSSTTKSRCPACAAPCRRNGCRARRRTSSPGGARDSSLSRPSPWRRDTARARRAPREARCTISLATSRIIPAAAAAADGASSSIIRLSCPRVIAR